MSYAACTLGGTSTGMAQAVAGIGDDAIPIPRGGYRLLVGGLWNDYRAVFAPGSTSGRLALLGGLATNAFGTTQLPQLTPVQASIRALTGNSAFALSLGELEARGEVRQSVAPITVDYGVTRRLSLRLLVPYVESRDASQLVLNRAGTGANVGRNPAFLSTGATARAANGALVGQIDAARAALAAEITRCSTPTEEQCAAIRANPAGAKALVSRAAATRTHLVTVYGDATRGGAPVVPLNGSALHTAVVSGIGALRTDFGAFGITAIPASAQPAAATVILGPGSIGTVASDSSFGVGYGRLGDTRRAGIGDVDLTASLLLVDSFKADQLRRLLTPGRGVRSNVTLGWRFGTAGADRTDDAFDVPIGDGANALLARSTTDVLFNRWAWMSATVRAVLPLADQVAILTPLRDEAGTFSAPVAATQAQRTLGNRFEIELAPRVAIGDFFGVSAAYLLRYWGSDLYNAADGPRLTVASRTVNAAALGFSFSTLASYARGRSRFPAEVIYTHTAPLSGSGALTPAISTDRLELRVYTGFPRR